MDGLEDSWWAQANAVTWGGASTGTLQAPATTRCVWKAGTPNELHCLSKKALANLTSSVTANDDDNIFNDTSIHFRYRTVDQNRVRDSQTYALVLNKKTSTPAKADYNWPSGSADSAYTVGNLSPASSYSGNVSIIEWQVDLPDGAGSGTVFPCDFLDYEQTTTVATVHRAAFSPLAAAYDPTGWGLCQLSATSINTPADTTAPTVSSCTALNVSNISMDLQCSLSDNQSTSFTVQVRYCTGSVGCTGTSFLTTAPQVCSGTCTVNVAGLTANATYRLLMKATDAAGNVSTNTTETVQATTTTTARYLSPSGSDSNNGTSSGTPWKTFAHAIPLLQPGYTLFLANGTYTGSTTGHLSVNCATGGNASNGTAGAPITVQATNERQAFIHGDGSDLTNRPVSIKNCSYWTIQGIRADDPNFSGKGAEGGSNVGNVFEIAGNHNLILRRNLGSKTDLRYNGQVFGMGTAGCVNCLYEENEAYDYHRHGFDAFQTSSDGNIFRRNYANSRNWGNFGPGSPTSGFSNYWANGTLWENNIADCDPTSCAGSMSNGFTNTGDTIRFLGNLALGMQSPFNSTMWQCVPAIRTVMDNNVALNATSNGNSSRSETSGTYTNNSIFTSAGAGFSNDLNTESCAASLQPAMTYRNNLSLSNGGSGFVMTAANGYSSLVLDFLDSSGNGGGGNYSSGTSGRTNSFSTAPTNPQCYVDAAHDTVLKNAGAGGGPVGATVLYQMVNGVLTSTHLWDETQAGAAKYRFSGCGAVIAGVNDTTANSCIGVHTRFHVTNAQCPALPY
jgi:hypothetical protein